MVDEPKNKSARSVIAKSGEQLQKLLLHAVHEGVGPLSGSKAYADDRMGRSDGDTERAIRRIIKESTVAAGSNGFVTGLGGFALMPVTLPVNVGGSLIINARMVGAIAYLRGYDLDDPHTQAILMLVVAGSGAQAALAELGVTLGKQGAKQGIKAVPISVIRQINKKAGFYLVAKYGTERSAVTLAKLVPVAGGLIGGGVDSTLTRFIGRQAKKAFEPDAIGEPSN